MPPPRARIGWSHEIEPCVDIAARRHWAHKVTAERCAKPPAPLEVRVIEEALADATGAWLGHHFRCPLAQPIEQTGNCLIARGNVEAGMGTSNKQFALPESCPKLFVHGGLGRYRGEIRLMISHICVRSIERWSGAPHQIAVSFHFNFLASRLGAPSVAAQ
jgi:hypothetical protein